MPSTVEVIFFFQAEDGIRDLTVTGVQTCALPISSEPPASGSTVSTVVIAPNPPPEPRVEVRPAPPGPNRSEERRVGKECRCRGSPCRARRGPCLQGVDRGDAWHPGEKWRDKAVQR